MGSNLEEYLVPGVVENVKMIRPSDININENNMFIPFSNKPKKPKGKKVNTNKCYTCNPRGTLKEHIISQTNDFVFNHDMFKRPLIIITTIPHYHTIYDVPDHLKIKLFEDIRCFVEFWNLSNDYQLQINNGDAQTHHHFHAKLKINESVANRMRRDHFARINLQKTYESC